MLASSMLLVTVSVASWVLPALAATAKGFNYSNRYPNKEGEATVFKVKADYVREFTAAKNLPGATGFTSARPFTMHQGETTAYIEAIPAAIETGTRLLLGIWASADTPENRDTLVKSQVDALSAAITDHGTAFTSLIDGVSIGSEDIYRTTERGLASGAGPGTDASDLIPYIKQVKTALAAYPSIPVTHVDTKGVWIDGNSKGVPDLIDAIDVIGLDLYIYYQNDTGADNSISSALSAFQTNFDSVLAVANAKHKGVWVTETGWPHRGPDYGPAVANVANAEKYWKQVGCWLWQKGISTWWYLMQDESTEEPGLPVIAFGVLPPSGHSQALPQTPLFDLTCPATLSVDAKREKRF